MKQLLTGAAASFILIGCANDSQPAALKGQSADSIVVRSGDPAQVEKALVAMSLDESGAGLLSFSDASIDGANASFSDVSIKSANGLTIGSVSFEGLDVVDGSVSFGRLSLNNVAMSGDGAVEGGFEFGSIALTNPSADLMGAISVVLQKAGEPDLPSDVSFDALSFSDLSGSFSDYDSDGTFTLRKIELLGMSDQKLDHFSISDISGSGQDGNSVEFALNELVVAGMDLRLLDALIENSDDPDAMAEAVIDLVYGNPIEPGYDAFALEALSLDMAGAPVSLPSMVSYVERNQDGVPVKFVTEPFELIAWGDAGKGPIGAGFAETLSMVSLDAVSLKAASDGRYDPETDIFEFQADGNYFELGGVARINMGGKLGGYVEAIGEMVDYDKVFLGMEPDPDQMFEALSEVSIHNFEISIDDLGLVELGFSLAAAQSGQSADELKSQVVMGLGMAPMMAQGAGVDMALVSEAATAISSFLQTPGQLSIKLAPASPLSMADVIETGDPAALTKEALGLSITAN